MGLFDTILLVPPLTCPRCGSATELQTKLFDPTMMTYRAGHEALTPVYLIVWHSILAGVALSEEDAHARLSAVDRVDLITWLDDAQRAEQDGMFQ